MNASDPFAPQPGGAGGHPDGGWSGAPAPVAAVPPVAARPAGRGHAGWVEPVVVVMTAVVIAATGAPLALVWWLIAPKVPIVVTSAGPVYVNYETEQFMSADGWFVTLGAAAGLVTAIVCWLAVRYHRGPAMLGALAAGSVAAAGLATWLGSQIGRVDYDYLLHHAPTGSIFYHPIALGAKGGLLVEAVLAVFVYTLIAGCSRYAMLTKHRRDPDDGRRQPQNNHDQPDPQLPANQLPPTGQPDPPSQPDQPNWAGQQGQSEWPGQTAQPAQQEWPGQSAQSDWPGQSAQSDWPQSDWSSQTTQAVPSVQSAQRGQPGQSGRPDQYGWPGQPTQPGRPDQPGRPGQAAQPGQSGGQWPTATASFPVAASGQPAPNAAQQDWLTNAQPVSPPAGPVIPASPAPDHSGPFQPYGFPRTKSAQANPAQANRPQGNPAQGNRPQVNQPRANPAQVNQQAQVNQAQRDPAQTGSQGQSGEQPIDPFARRSPAGPVDPFAPPSPAGPDDWPR